MPSRFPERSGQGLTPQQLVSGTCLFAVPLGSNFLIMKLNDYYKRNRKHAENPSVSGISSEQGRHRGRGCPPSWRPPATVLLCVAGPLLSCVPVIDTRGPTPRQGPVTGPLAVGGLGWPWGSYVYVGLPVWI